MEILEQIDWTPIMNELVKIIIGVVSLLVSTKLIPYLEKKLSNEQLEVAKKVVEAFVKAAEQVYECDQCQEKKDYVLVKAQEALDERHIKIDLTELDALIESAVFGLPKTNG